MTSHWDELSAVRSVEFDRATHTLRIGFASGAVYDFADVPVRVYEELAHSPKADDYFRQNIRDEFAGTRIGDVDLGEIANERREDAILGSPLGEDVPRDVTDERRAEPDDIGVLVRGSRHTWVVDMMDEDSAAVQVDGRQITPMPRWLLPADARDGDVLRVTHARSGPRSTLSIEVDRAATRLAYERSADQLRDMPAGGRGDVNL
jgi:hypothetical protein